MKALCLIRHALIYRREVFIAGLHAAGYEVVDRLDKPAPDDVLVIWNRYGMADDAASRFERAGAKVVVCENGYLGKSWNGETWIAMSQGHHAGAGVWRAGGNERWDRLDVAMKPFRTGGNELVILGQRGIGEPGVASPSNWAELMQRRYGGRIRRHPGNVSGLDLESDLEDAHSIMTWHSGAALKALLLGVPVWYGFHRWIGAGAAKPLERYGEEPNRDEAARLHMFRQLAWAQWRLGSEIRTGEAFRHLLNTGYRNFVSDASALI